MALELAALGLILAAGFFGSGVVRAWPPTYTADLTRLDAPSAGFDLAGVHIVEQNDQFGYTWSSGYTLAQLRNGYNAASGYRASVQLRAANPGGPQPLTFLVNERPLATVTPATAFRTYHVLLPPGGGDDRSLRFAFETPTFQPPGDARNLGVILSGITLQPVPSSDWRLALLIVALVAMLWGWLRWRGASPVSAWLICALLMAAQCALYGLYRPAPLSFGLLASAAIGATAIGAWLAREPISRLGLAALALLVSFSGMIWPSWLTDDAFISFRYAQNLVAGHGLVYNVGERVEGYTNFLWTMLAALGLWLGGDLTLLAYASGVVLGLAIVLLTCWLARRLLGPAWALAAALIVATSQTVLVYSGRGSGLETALFTLLALAGSACAISRRGWRWSGVIFALATLARPDGALFMAVTVVYLWLAGAPAAEAGLPLPRRLRALLIPVAGYLLIFAPYFLWRTAYYGDLLPNTFYAKTGGGLAQVARGLGYTGAFALTLGGPLALVAFAPLARGWRAARGWRGYLLALIVVYTLYIIAVGGDHFPGNRFFTPLAPWLALTIADGLAWLYTLAQSRPALRRLAPIALAAALLIYSGAGLIRGDEFNSIIKGDDESLGIWRELGWWFHDHGRPGESIAATGAGAVAFYSDRTTIDLLGLTDRHIARIQSAMIGAGTAGHEKRDPAYVLDVRQPTYIPAIWEEYFGGERALQSRYTRITVRTRYGRELTLWKRLCEKACQ